MAARTLTRNSRPVRWVDSEGVRRELRPGDAIPEEALAACPEGRLTAHKGGGELGGRVLSTPVPPEPPVAASMGATLAGASEVTAGEPLFDLTEPEPLVRPEAEE